MGLDRDYEAELQMLRGRIAELESTRYDRTDSVLVSFLKNHASFFSLITPEGRFIATGRESDTYGSVVGRSVYEFMSEEAGRVVQAALAQACASLLPVNYEADGAGEDGNPDRVYQVRAVPIVTEGKANAVVLVPTDVTERVRLERTLRESSDSLRLAVSATGMGFWRFDVENGHVTWDARMLQIFGIEGIPPDYATYLKLIHPDDVPLIEGAVRQALESGVYPTVEHRICPADGRAERWILGAATVEQDANGRPLVIRGGALDITDRKNLTRQMERAERVQAVGQLAAGIAHNFNNLLAVILPTLAMAIEHPTDPDPESLEGALTAALRARDLVKNLFSLTTIQPSRAGETADLSEAVRRTTQICRVHFPRQIELSIDVGADAVVVPISASDLEHLILNLLTNARDALDLKHSGQACIAVRVRTRDSGIDGSRIAELVVSDNGTGMSEETRRHIFEPFFTTKGPDRGTGLGLATVAARLRAARGSIECTSQVAQGTTFTVELPLCPSPEPSGVATENEANRSLSGRVLIVDDERLVRSTLRRLLELSGLEVYEAANTAEARDVLDRTSVDLIILDDSMPVESGLQALKSFGMRSSAQVMLFTGYAPEVPEGIAAYVRKPAHPEEIVRTVQSLLRSKVV